MSEPNPIEKLAGIAGEHFSNYAIAVINEEDGELEYRFNNKKIATMMFAEGVKDLIRLDRLEGVEIVWDDEEVGGEETEE